ncbi:MAG: hypothetical protein WAX69_15285 [Victivallales bacterium]
MKKLNKWAYSRKYGISLASLRWKRESGLVKCSLKNGEWFFDDEPPATTTRPEGVPGVGDAELKAARFEKLQVQTEQIRQQIERERYGQFLLWAGLMKEALIESASIYSGKITALKLSPETIVEINKAFEECFTDASNRLNEKINDNMKGTEL